MPVSKSGSKHQENRAQPKKHANRENRTKATSAENSNDDFAEDAAGVTVKDLRVPEATVYKLMKEALPKNAVISQEVKDIMRRIPTIFALFLTDHALQKTHNAKRRTLLPEDVVAALEDNGFGSYCDKVMPVVEQRRANFRSRKPKVESTEDTKNTSAMEKTFEKTFKKTSEKTFEKTFKKTSAEQKNQKNLNEKEEIIHDEIINYSSAESDVPQTNKKKKIEENNQKNEINKKNEISQIELSEMEIETETATSGSEEESDSDSSASVSASASASASADRTEETFESSMNN